MTGKLIRAVLAAGAMLIFGANGSNAADVLRIGEGPYITGGGFLVANEKGYFKKLGLDIQPRMFIDGQQAVPALIAGELDLSVMTANPSLFNSITRGAPL